MEIGENDKQEFKEDFPQQAHELAKELAAFATAGGGRLFLGINDNCEIRGLSVGSAEKRDELKRRLRGIAARVKPELEFQFGLAFSDGKTIAFVEVIQQQEPVYYYEGRPYIRDNDESRPATPEEVKNSVWSHPSSEFKREEEKISLNLKKLQYQSIKDNQERLSQHRRDQAAIRRSFNP